MDSDVILHLFDWRFRDILRAIPGIVADGFGAIQISPPQLSVDTEEWWGRYQPIDHTRIEGPLGSEQELRDLIRKAHQSSPPIRVIIDVVFNHMAESQPEREFLRYPRFGPEHFHVQAAIDWRSVESIRTGWVGYGPDLPDLRTEHPYVRSEARKYIDLLLDCGADGFRFDAVKHIEPEFFDEVLKDVPPALIVYGEYILQPGHKPVMEQYLGNMRLMDFALLETMAKAFAIGGDMRMLVDPASQGHALPDYQGIAFVTNHDLELGEVGGFGLPADSLDLGHVYTITRPESIPLIWKEHRHNPVVKACMKLRQLSRMNGREIVLNSDRLMAWRFGDQGAAIINASPKAISLTTVNLGLRDTTAINMLTGSPVEQEILVPPRQSVLLWILGKIRSGPIKMEDIIFQKAHLHDFSKLAEWLILVSQDPAQHCLHTWAGQNAEGLAEQFLSYWHDEELSYIMALRDGRLIGAIGGEYDRDLGRAWLHGPHASQEDWDALAGALYHRLLTELPQEIRQLDAYMNIENVRGRRFYGEQGFKERDNLNYDFWLVPEQRVVSSEGGCKPLEKAQESSFEGLFMALFPRAYYSAERIIEMIGQSHQVLVEAQGETVLGFAVVSIEGDRSEGELQFFGVREDSRRKGYGRKLLISAIDWLLDAGVERVTLNVAEELVHARSLYESVGFRLEFTGVGLEKKLGDG